MVAVAALAVMVVVLVVMVADAALADATVVTVAGVKAASADASSKHFWFSPSRCLAQGRGNPWQPCQTSQSPAHYKPNESNRISTTFSSRMATNGDKSSIPTVGTTRRNGRSNGSVKLSSKSANGLP